MYREVRDREGKESADRWAEKVKTEMERLKGLK